MPLIKWIKKILDRITKKLLLNYYGESYAHLKAALASQPGVIPVFIVCYNNGIYVTRMTEQLQIRGIKPIILDNKSTDRETIFFLKQAQTSGIADVIYIERNLGHLAGFKYPFFESLPEYFAYTDPDLLFNPGLPADFLEQLKDVAIQYGTFKAGMALDIEPENNLGKQTFSVSRRKPFSFSKNYSIYNWEKRYWRKKLIHPKLEIYAAPIDTTMAVYVKSNYSGDTGDAVRVAGVFSAIHLPWFPSFDPMTRDQRDMYIRGNRSSTWIRRS